MKLRSLSIAAFAAGFIAVVVACDGNRGIYEGQPCPCVTGYSCCDDVCRPDSCDDEKSSRGDDDDTSSITSSGGKTTVTDPYIQTLTSRDSALCIAADPTTVFWMNENATISAGSTVDTSQIVVSMTNPPPNLGVTSCAMHRIGDGLYVTATGVEALYWFSVAFEGARPKVGERSFKLASFSRPTSLVHDDESVYVLEGDSGNIHRIKKVPANGPPDAGAASGESTLVGTGNADAYGLVLDGDFFFWFDSAGLRKMPKGGGTIFTLATLPLIKDPYDDPFVDASAPRHARDLQVANGNLYWIDDRKLMTLPVAGGVAHELKYTPAGSLSGLVYSFTATSGGLLLSHATVLGLLPFAAPTEKLLFSYIGKSEVNGMAELVFDTSRYLWIGGDRRSVAFRPVLETDATASP